MKWVVLIALAIVASWFVGGSDGVLSPSPAAAVDSLWAIKALNEIICVPRLHESFYRLIHEDKEARQSTKKDSPAWLKAKKDPRAYLRDEGVDVPENVHVAFVYTIPAKNEGLYCMELCINLHGGKCTSCAHPERTGCLAVRYCYPLSAL